jgi:valyl-tRNA synthetase
VRLVRARYRVAPKTTVDVIARAGGAEATLLANQEQTIRTLAGVGALTIDAEATKPAHAAVAVAAGGEIFVPLEGLVDFEHERARVEKELGSARTDLERLERKLGNEGFLAKAAPEVVEKDRAKAEELSAAVATLTGQLAELSD